MSTKRKDEVGRRSFLRSAGTLAAAPLLGGIGTEALAQSTASSGSGARSTTPAAAPGRRRLGKLEVSSIGLGVQNMSRKYDTTVPYRPEMVAHIRRAFDSGVTFFDTAQAHGPHECERILGEAIQSFRKDVVITSKFGWNIDPESGQFRAGQPPTNK